MNAAAQPTGNILNLDLSFGQRAFLRSSPAIYLFDAIGAVASLFHGIYPAPTISRAREEATEILMRRMLDEQGRPDLHAIRVLKTQRWPRWIGFLLGVLPQFLKLFAAHGVRISQALGAIYLVSWLIFEILILLADTGSPPRPNPRTHTSPTHKATSIYYTCLALFTSSILYSIPAWSVYLNCLTFVSDAPALPYFIIIYLFYPTGLLGIHTLLWRDILWTPEAKNNLVYAWLAVISATTHFGMPLAAMQIGPPFASSSTFFGRDGNVGMWLWVVEGALITPCILSSGVVLFCRDGEGVAGRMGWVVRVLGMVVLPLFNFGVFYDPRGTGVPGWTVILG